MLFSWLYRPIFLLYFSANILLFYKYFLMVKGNVSHFHHLNLSHVFCSKNYRQHTINTRKERQHKQLIVQSIKHEKKGKICSKKKNMKRRCINGCQRRQQIFLNRSIYQRSWSRKRENVFSINTVTSFRLIYFLSIWYCWSRFEFIATQKNNFNITNSYLLKTFRSWNQHMHLISASSCSPYLLYINVCICFPIYINIYIYSLNFRVI